MFHNLFGLPISIVIKSYIFFFFCFVLFRFIRYTIKFFVEKDKLLLIVFTISEISFWLISFIWIVKMFTQNLFFYFLILFFVLVFSFLGWLKLKILYLRLLRKLNKEL